MPMTGRDLAWQNDLHGAPQSMRCGVFAAESGVDECEHVSFAATLMGMNSPSRPLPPRAELDVFRRFPGGTVQCYGLGIHTGHGGPLDT
jgi:hypothetical protein